MTTKNTQVSVKADAGELGSLEVITLSNRDFDAFWEAINADREPGEALRQAAERFKKRHQEHEDRDDGDMANKSD